MEKKEFVDYIKYINKVFNTNIDVSDKELMSAYYKPFKNIHVNIAKDMVQKYMQVETGKFKLAKLLEYKSSCLKGKTWIDNTTNKNCKLCAGTGFVIVEEEHNGKIYEMWKRCNCKQGGLLPDYINKIDESVVYTHYVDFKGVFRLEKQKEVEVSKDYISSIKEMLKEG